MPHYHSHTLLLRWGWIIAVDYKPKTQFVRRRDDESEQTKCGQAAGWDQRSGGGAGEAKGEGAGAAAGAGSERCQKQSQDAEKGKWRTTPTNTHTQQETKV